MMLSSVAPAAAVTLSPRAFDSTVYDKQQPIIFDSPTRLLGSFIHQLSLVSSSDSSPISTTLVSHNTLPTMADTYLSFLRSPSESALASDAALHYITTTTSIHDSAAIIKHFQAQDKVVKKKSENVLSSFGTSDGAVVETDTTFEFIRGGGAILPQMDDNMLADSVASLPMVGTDLALTVYQI
jgi:hypothetical protein